MNVISGHDVRRRSRLRRFSESGNFCREITKPLDVSVPGSRETDRSDSGGKPDERNFEKRDVVVEAPLKVMNTLIKCFGLGFEPSPLRKKIVLLR